MAFSAILGLCVLGADVAVLNRVLQSHAGTLQVAFTSVFALSVAGLWAWGYHRSWQFLSLSAREAAALPETASKLGELAKDVERRLTDGANVAPKPLSDHTPILDRRVQETWLALRRGAPLQSVDLGLRGRQRASDPEREIRTVTDIGLAVGITGSVVAIHGNHLNRTVPVYRKRRIGCTEVDTEYYLQLLTPQTAQNRI